MLSWLLSLVPTWFYILVAVSNGVAVVLMILTALAPTKGAVYYYLRLVTYVYVASLLLFPAIPLFCIRPKDVNNTRWYAAVLAPITKIFKITWELRGKEHFITYPGTTDNYKNGAIIVANHQSEFDILGMWNMWGHVGRCTPVAKNILFWIWPFGLAAYLGGTLFIKRSNARDSMRLLQETAAAMKKRQTKIYLFPEGTRNKVTGRLLPFKKGAFRTALAAQCPIIPLVYSPYYFIDTKEKIFEPGHMIMEALPPVSTEGLEEKDVDKLMNDIRDSMYKVYARLYKETTGQDCPPDRPLENGETKKVK